MEGDSSLNDSNQFRKIDIEKGIEMWKEKVQLFVQDTLERKILKCLFEGPMSVIEIGTDLEADPGEMETSLDVLIAHGLVKGTGPYSITSVGEAFVLYSSEDLEDLQQALFDAAKELNEST